MDAGQQFKRSREDFASQWKWDPERFRNMGGTQLTYSPPQEAPAWAEGHHVIRMINGNGLNVWHLAWHPKTGRIGSVSVDDEYQSLGVATEMYKHAQKLADIAGIASPQHSNERTSAGTSWAKHVGGHLPENDWEW